MSTTTTTTITTGDALTVALRDRYVEEKKYNPKSPTTKKLRQLWKWAIDGYPMPAPIRAITYVIEYLTEEMDGDEDELSREVIDGLNQYTKQPEEATKARTA